MAYTDREKLWLRPHQDKSPREKLWSRHEENRTPLTTTVSSKFISSLKPAAKILDIGCGDGRGASKLKTDNNSVTGIDINAHELSLGREQHPTIDFVESSARELPFKTGSFDAVIALGLLGGIEKSARQEVVEEAGRVLAPGGLMYVAEFAPIADTSDLSKGMPWHEIYKRGYKRTKEMGSFAIYADDGTEQVIVHHFAEGEIERLMTSNGMQIIATEKPTAINPLNQYARSTWNVWAQTKQPNDP
jgi:ubiquinone/menaquinone biosynthesis C-methylase UbiE